MYINYKDYFSINLLAVGIPIYIWSYRKDCDSSIFKATIFWKKLKVHIPIPRLLSEHSNTNVSFVIIGEEDFRN